MGIILPEDKRTRAIISFSNPDNYFLEFDSARTQEPVPSTPLPIKTEGLRLEIDYKMVKRVTVKQRSGDRDTTVTVKDVVAGRGFHWKKKIPVSLPGSLEISVHQGFLMLINELPLETYLACVATSEMSAHCPASLLEAQTIVARSWVLAGTEKKHTHLGIDVCNDDCCQRYQGTNFLTPHAKTAVKATSGQVLTYQNTICDTRYSKSCGGRTETFATIWQNLSPPPYLVSLPDFPEAEASRYNQVNQEEQAYHWITSQPPAYCSPVYLPEDDLPRYLGSVDEAGQYYRWSQTYLQEGLADLLRTKSGLPITAILGFIPRQRGPSARISILDIAYRDREAKERTLTLTSEYEIRRHLAQHFLFSSALVFEPPGKQEQPPDSFTLLGAGWGHGVGLCQIGALGMSLTGRSMAEILSHYYPQTKLQSLYA